jgi:hypothetical protein
MILLGLHGNRINPPPPTCACREGLCLPASLEMADIFIESPAAYTIRYGDRDIDSAFLKVIKSLRVSL